MDLDLVTKALVSLVTIDGRPYKCLDDEGMKILLNIIYDGCERAGIQYRINRDNIGEHVSRLEKEMETQIVKEIQDMLLSVQMDIASALER